MHDEVAHELARLLAEIVTREHKARIVAVKAGFPESRLPAWSGPEEFWSEVARGSSCGVIPSLLRLVEAAHEEYPHNDGLSGFGARLVDSQEDRGSDTVKDSASTIE